MAGKGTSSMAIALVMVISAITMAAAQSNNNDCTNVLIGLSPCLNYISGNSSAPSQGCCTQLSTVVGSQPQCLCQVLNGGGSNLGLNINQTQAMELPKACKVQTPPVSQCNSAGSPSGSPADGSSTPNSPNSNTNGGSKTVPSGTPAAASTTTSAASLALFSFGSLIAFYVSA